MLFGRKLLRSVAKSPPTSFAWLVCVGAVAWSRHRGSPAPQLDTRAWRHCLRSSIAGLKPRAWSAVSLRDRRRGNFEIRDRVRRALQIGGYVRVLPAPHTAPQVNHFFVWVCTLHLVPQHRTRGWDETSPPCSPLHWCFFSVHVSRGNLVTGGWTKPLPAQRSLKTVVSPHPGEHTCRYRSGLQQ